MGVVAEWLYDDKCEECDALRAALRNLTVKVKECGEASVPVFQFAAVHGYAYSGPNWTEELKAAEAALS